MEEVYIINLNIRLSIINKQSARCDLDQYKLFLLVNLALDSSC